MLIDYNITCIAYIVVDLVLEWSACITNHSFDMFVNLYVAAMLFSISYPWINQFAIWEKVHFSADLYVMACMFHYFLETLFPCLMFHFSLFLWIHRKTGTYLVSMLQWVGQEFISLLAKSGVYSFKFV